MSVRARVTVTLEIDVDSYWSDDVKADQVRKQAIESAIGACRQGLVVDGYAGKRDPAAHARIIGEPVVEAIIATLAAARKETP